jgi:hypothetical protein
MTEIALFDNIQKAQIFTRNYDTNVINQYHGFR